MAGFPRKKHFNNTTEKLDFSSVKKLFGYIKAYLPSIIVALVLAVFAAVTTIIGPDKISDLLNLITEGIAVETGVDMTKFFQVLIFLICLIY